MSADIQWTDLDPDTGLRRWICAEKFARRWEFKVRLKRRENWRRGLPVSKAMWLDLLDALERRLPRREGVMEEDVHDVQEIIKRLPED
jgi:hypothetical protein